MLKCAASTLISALFSVTPLLDALKVVVFASEEFRDFAGISSCGGSLEASNVTQQLATPRYPQLYP